MEKSQLHRRDFNRLTAAALGGMMAGAVAGCGPSSDSDAASDSTENQSTAGKHLCRGLNECKEQGADKENGCRGMGTCATYAHHECGLKNACKGQGGCGEEVGTNACKGKGGCSVPLMDHAWDEVREKLVAKWKQGGNEYHDPPAKPKK
jgi:hypothetical protein